MAILFLSLQEICITGSILFSMSNEDAAKLEKTADLDLPEILFPAWMTAILRLGSGPDATVLALPFNPPGGHRQADNLSLYYVDCGQTVLGDLGYVGDSPMNAWVRGTSLSHNLVIVDDQEQGFRAEGKKREPRFRFMATSPRVSVVEASSRVYPQCADYRRLVALIKGPGAQTIALDIFRIRGGDKHAYRLFSELAASDAMDVHRSARHALASRRDALQLAQVCAAKGTADHHLVPLCDHIVNSNVKIGKGGSVSDYRLFHGCWTGGCSWRSVMNYIVCGVDLVSYGQISLAKDLLVEAAHKGLVCFGRHETTSLCDDSPIMPQPGSMSSNCASKYDTRYP